MRKASYRYDQVAHSPLILAEPGIPRNLYINSLCEAVDTKSTLGQQLNFPPPPTRKAKVSSPSSRNPPPNANQPSSPSSPP